MALAFMKAVTITAGITSSRRVKSQTYAVEADNAELRHYLKCLARSTRCFAKHLDSLIRRVKVFVHCWNQRQLQRRAFPKYVPPLFSFASFQL